MKLASDEEDKEQIGPFSGVPVLGLDALAAASYGPEAALTVLLPLGALGLRYIVPLSALVIALLTIVYVSYRQTIVAYPNGGGSYIVAKENLGTSAGLVRRGRARPQGLTTTTAPGRARRSRPRACGDRGG
ncbi:uncharacterized protein SOCE26_087080 [Sorangium cellulosum]|uniref:Uncharacterized protein n=1 Tax=Sorangium cellulosum TaxID=56 RepID=A0A2L0F6J7_SORCE|nr:hypothetical protein [Sorangium cellulosum]AUX47196.1 uncharacterized protein SOCE26_087080 [Sorangium cellulosum]